ncbi:MAG: helix-turn-helix domain-containing protein [Clostridia bacterium]|nr:helix-turn-helix domain-containing protein [Clostridia bacterium]
MDKSLDERITQNLKYEIETCGKKKTEIAKALGVTPGTISQYLSGNTQPTLANLSRLCSFIGCSADDILCVEETNKT